MKLSKNGVVFVYPMYTATMTAQAHAWPPLSITCNNGQHLTATYHCPSLSSYRQDNFIFLF